MAVGTCPPHVHEPEQEREHGAAALVRRLPPDVLHVVGVNNPDHEAEHLAPLGAKVVPGSKADFRCSVAEN